MGLNRLSFVARKWAVFKRDYWCYLKSLLYKYDGLTRHETQTLITPWYHNFAELGLKTRVEGGPFQANNEAKARVLKPLIREAGKLVKNPKILEQFCADGFWAMWASRELDGCAWGIDRDPYQIDKARLAARACGFEEQNFGCGDVSQQHGDFDLALCLGGLYHTPDPAMVLHNIPANVMVLQTVLGGVGFESPAPHWGWGCRFDLSWLMGQLKGTGWKVRGEPELFNLPGNSHKLDKTSVAMVCVRDG